MHPGLPSLSVSTGLVLLVTACDAEAPRTPDSAIPDAYLERLQQAEAIRYDIEQHDLEQRRVDEVLGGDQARPATR